MSRRQQRSNNLPSTPNRRSLQSQPSTTPLVPPPSHLTTKSTTPAGPPPRSIFGSSYNPSNATFSRYNGSALKSFTIPDSSPPRDNDDDDDEDEDGGELPDEQHQQLDATGDDDTALELFGRNSTLMSSIGANTRGLKRSHNGKLRPERQSDLPAIARAYAKKRRNNRLPESDAIVLDAERAVNTLVSASTSRSAEEQDDVFATTVARLTSGWRNVYSTETKEGGIGPEDEDDTAKAAYVASFVLQLHHPHPITNDGCDHSVSGQLARRGAETIPMPRALLDWLNSYHNPFPDDFESILSTHPAPSANESFWDVVFASILRGKIDRAVTLLRRAGWEHAITALDDDSSQPGYSGHRLQNTRACAEQCIKVLSSCPASQQGNWDVRDGDWALFRQRAQAALNELQAFAGEGSEEDEESDNIFSRSQQGTFNFSRASRKAGSKVPWSIFENLKLLYSQLLGHTSEILMTSQDWLEASIFLTVWWDGDDEFNAGASLSRSALRKEAKRPREVDVTPLRAYRSRLGDAFILATNEAEETGFSIDTTDAAQLGIASALEDNPDGVLCILQSLSLPIAAVVADIAALGGWLPNARLRNRELLSQGFSSEDLLVLSHGPGSTGAGSGGADREEILLQYADLLVGKDKLQDEAGNTIREGWQVASAVYGRLHDHGLADQRIAELLDGLEIESSTQANKVLHLCAELGLTDQARRVAERFADRLTVSGQEYGAILVFYARAHAYDKLDNTLTLLTSFCLVQSTAMPPQSTIDQQLASLLTDRAELRALMHIDREAALYLAAKLSGYATARSFYELRDHELLRTQDRAGLKPLKRKRGAARALLSLILSAADCIRGGLFDPEVQSVVPIDGILVLLGEVIPLCRQTKRILSSRDIFALLQVIEDFSASPVRIREAAEDVLRACKEASSSRSGAPPSLQKSKSDVSTQSGLSESSYELLMASSSLLGRSSSSKQSSVVIERAWDWRKGLAGLHSDVNAQSLLLLLRTVLADELGRVWTESPE